MEDPKNEFLAKCSYCGHWVAVGEGRVRQGKRVSTVYHDGPCPDISSGLGIGGIGSDDHNIHTDRDTGPWAKSSVPAGHMFSPTGTTQGERTPGAKCARCGKSANWNPGAGEYLCNRHWDEY